MIVFRVVTSIVRFYDISTRHFYHPYRRTLEDIQAAAGTYNEEPD